jgi:SUF system NifU family Fe-S assembly protein
VTLRVRLADDTIGDISYEGMGCSISQASASVLHELLCGMSVADSLKRHEAFTTLMAGRGQVEPDEALLEDAVAFAGVAKYPARVKCALLPWMAYKDALSRTTRWRDDMTAPEERHGRGRRRHRRGDEGRRRPRAGHQRRRPRPRLRRPRRRGERRDPRHDADLGRLPAHRRDRGPGPDALCKGPGGGLVNDIRINWVWLPPWGPDKITDDGREQLRPWASTSSVRVGAWPADPAGRPPAADRCPREHAVCD